MNKTYDVAVIVGSLRKDSINRKVANAIAEIAPASLKLSIIDIAQLPIYNQDGDENPPAAAGHSDVARKFARLITTELIPTVDLIRLAPVCRVLSAT